MKVLKNIDRRIIYLLVLVALAFPILRPIGLPFTISQPARDVFEAVDALEPGDIAVLSFDYSPSGSAQLHPQARAIMSHLFQKEGIRFVNVSFWPSGPLFADQFVKEFEGTHNKVYGEDFVSLGYIAGAETAISSFAKNVHAAFPKDRFGTPVKDIPLMEDIKSADDIDLLIELSSGSPGVEEHIRQIVTVYGTPMVVGMNSVSVAGNIPYYNAGQMKGYLNGLRGAAEYEMLLGEPGAATASMDSLSFSHLTVIAFIILGNIAYFTDPERKKK